jgi:hypothetical protein
MSMTYLVRGMVDDKIKDDSHATIMRFGDQPLHILQRAVRLINVFVVPNIISHIDLRRINSYRANVVQF